MLIVDDFMNCDGCRTREEHGRVCLATINLGSTNMRYHRFQDPADKVNTTVVEQKPEVSYLARWADQGWSIEIQPKLTDKQWRKFNERADECWNEELQNYDVNKAYALLLVLFPIHSLRILVPPPLKKEKK